MLNQSNSFKVAAAADGYMQFRCRQCDGIAFVDYVGLDQSLPMLHAHCDKCEIEDTWKLMKPRDGWSLAPKGVDRTAARQLQQERVSQ